MTPATESDGRMLPRLTVLAATILVSTWCWAQEAPATPEIGKLARYLGAWQYEGEDKTPLSGGPVRCEAQRRLISGGYFVESHRECETPRGRSSEVEMFGYDFQRRVYLYWGFSGRTVSTYTSPDVDGNFVVWTGTGASQGNRCTETFVSGFRSSTDKCETTTDGGATWVIRAQGKSTKLR
jgi:hypothetical protein